MNVLYHEPSPPCRSCARVSKCFHRPDGSSVQLSLSYRFTWTKDDKPFHLSDPQITVSNNSGTFRISNNGHVSHFQGKYRCFATNKLGVAMSEEIEFIVPSECYDGGFVALAKCEVEVIPGTSAVARCNSGSLCAPYILFVREVLFRVSILRSG